MYTYLYLCCHCYTSQVQEIRRTCDTPLGKDMHPPDQKFLFVPVAFLLLRLGSIIFSILYVYTHAWNSMSSRWRLLVQFYMVITAVRPSWLILALVHILYMLSLLLSLCDVDTVLLLRVSNASGHRSSETQPKDLSMVFCSACSPLV